MIRTITMRTFGRMGRFANSMFQYAFLRHYAEEHGCELQLPSWVGSNLFGHDHTPIKTGLPRYDEHAPLDWFCQARPPRGDELVNHDFSGYAQYHTSYFRPWAEEFRALFEPVGKARERVARAKEQLLEAGSTIIGIHLRRGDYGQLYFHITPTSWYRTVLGEIWGALQDPILFVASEDPSLVDDFAQFNPITTRDLEVSLERALPHYNYLQADLQRREPWQMDFFPDWYLLTCCDYLLIANSTFSFIAAMLNRQLQRCWRSNLILEGLEEIDPWNAYPMLRDTVDDYPVPGTFLETNPPYWDKRTRVVFSKRMLQ